MTFPQRINYITLGARDMATLRAFYAGVGWSERPGSSDEFATYEAGTTLLALYPIGQLGEEAAPGERSPESGWKGFTLGINLESTRAVDDTFQSAVALGARPVVAPVTRAWGGYSGYFSDPEDNRWEITWAP